MTTSFQRRNFGTLEEAYRVFFEALKQDSIEALIRTAWEFFGLPVLMTDENYKLVCQYPKKTGSTHLGCPV